MRYDALIERDFAAIPAAVAEFRASHSAEETWTAVTRFAVLAFAPSQHSKHALLSCLSVWDLREQFGDRFDEAIVECAMYAAASRQPWSEPPILDPPKLASDQRGDAGELRAAIAAGDRLRAERWLAKRYRDADFAQDYLGVAAENLADFGHCVIVTNAALRLTRLLGEKGAFAVLRVGVWEMVAVGSSCTDARRASFDEMIDGVIASDGDVEAAHALFLHDAFLQNGAEPTPAADSRLAPPVYRFGRDYGALLKMHAVATRIPEAARAIPAMERSLASMPPFEEMTFA